MFAKVVTATGMIKANKVFRLGEIQQLVFVP